MKRRRLLLSTLFLLLLLVGVSASLTYRAVRQERLNRALIAAIKKDDANTAIALLDEGADANAQDVPPQSPSLWRYLLDRLHGKRPQAKSGPSALLVALDWRPTPNIVHKQVVYGPSLENLPLIRALLAHGANVNVRIVTAQHRTLKGDSPLLLALEQDKVATARLLIQHGADVNADNEEGETPLMGAKTLDLLRILVAQGADVKARDKNGGTVLMWQVSSSDPVKNIRFLVENGADVHAANNRGETILHYSAYWRDRRLVAFLLDKGADVNAQDDNGHTPLQWALYPPVLETVQMLLAHHAKVTLKAKDGETALMFTKRALVERETTDDQKQYRRILQLLKQAGARK